MAKSNGEALIADQSSSRVATTPDAAFCWLTASPGLAIGLQDMHMCQKTAL